jgi:hypothetical protein
LWDGKEKQQQEMDEYREEKKHCQWIALGRTRKD